MRYTSIQFNAAEIEVQLVIFFDHRKLEQKLEKLGTTNPSANLPPTVPVQTPLSLKVIIRRLPGLFKLNSLYRYSTATSLHCGALFFLQFSYK